MDEELLELARQVKKRRIDKKLTQKEMATAIGITQTHLSNLENGRAHLSLELLVKMEAIFGCKLADFFCPENAAGSVLKTADGRSITEEQLGAIVTEVIKQICKIK